mgnify:FL=1|nr:MAG TPA: baseplate protein [Caudoviricetes sp.]
MANSNFKVFAEAVAALNVVSDAEYATDTQRINGVVPGLASAALHNKLYKQATIMAAALAQVLVEQGQDALDSDYAALVASLKKSLVLSLNGEKPDRNGNIQKNFVYSVEGKKPDSSGNVSLNIDYLNAMSFVGSVVITRDNINPGTKIGGTWQLLQSGRYIRTAGDGYAGGTLGGSDGFVLTQKQLPAHSHEATIYGVTNFEGSFIGANQVGLDGGKTTGCFKRTGEWAGTCAHKGDAREVIKFYGNHTHQITIKSTGNGEKVTFEPSYLCLYFWVRTA